LVRVRQRTKDVIYFAKIGELFMSIQTLTIIYVLIATALAFIIVWPLLFLIFKRLRGTPANWKVELLILLSAFFLCLSWATQLISVQDVAERKLAIIESELQSLRFENRESQIADFTGSISRRKRTIEERLLEALEKKKETEDTIESLQKQIDDLRIEIKSTRDQSTSAERLSYLIGIAANSASLISAMFCAFCAFIALRWQKKATGGAAAKA
jgi:hypothetical protein